MPAIRDLVSETSLLSSQFICPFFIKEGSGLKEPIQTLPHVYKWSLDRLIEEIGRLYEFGLRAIILFPIVQEQFKDHQGSYALNPQNFLCKSIATIKHSFPDLCVISDLALDPYTSHGHDGIVQDGMVLNDETVQVLAKMAVLHASQGADIVAPSDMMDGRVAEIRRSLDSANCIQTSILSYSVKYASSLYAPFRDALSSHLSFGDKRTYQMDFRNTSEALIEISLDEEEGADMLMIKPAGFYLDVIHRARNHTHLPIVAYQVSGEYAMIMASETMGMNSQSVLFESIVAIKRAGASMIITYAAPQILENYVSQGTIVYA